MAARHALVDLTPLRSSPPFRRLWLGRACSGVGSQIMLVAVLYQVWEQTGSTLWTGAVGLAQALPLVGFGLFAGSLVDRGDRRRLYLTANVGQAACSAVLAAQLLTGPLPIPALLAVLAVQALFGAVGGPAARTFIPRLLPPEQVAAGLALNRITFQGSLLLGPALGGLLIGWAGVGVCYLVDAVTFALAFAGAAGLPRMRPQGESARPGLRGVADGLRFIGRSAPTRGALLTDLAATVLAMPVSLFPLVNAERFGGDPRTLGLFPTAIAVGGVAASVLSGSFTRLPRAGLVMLAGAAAWGAALAAFGLAADPYAGLACLAVAGAADTVAVVARGTVVQLSTPDALLGRVVAAEQVVGQAGPELGNMRAGAVAAAGSGAVALVGGGLACVLVVALVGATTPQLRRPVTAAPGPP